MRPDELAQLGRPQLPVREPASSLTTAPADPHESPAPPATAGATDHTGGTRMQHVNRRSLDRDDLALARSFVAACRFTYARTVPEHPHEYCLRDWVDGEAFDRFVTLIAAHGYPGSFWHQRWTYLDVATGNTGARTRSTAAG
jgi:hypothetical protein